MSQTLFGDTDDLGLCSWRTDGQTDLSQRAQAIWGQQANLWANSLSGLFGALGSIGAIDLGPDENGWYDYQYSRLRKDILLQFQRRGYVVTQWIGYADFHEMFNVANLYWRYTGIGKHQMEAKLAFSPASAITSVNLPNLTAVYTGAKKPKAKKKAKKK
jgi:hypothetical protein